MKVMCINEDWRCVECGSENHPHPNYGDIDTVIREEVRYSSLYFSLERFGEIPAFRSDLFIPLSDIDETELLEQREQQTVSI